MMDRSIMTHPVIDGTWYSNQLSAACAELAFDPRGTPRAWPSRLVDRILFETVLQPLDHQGYPLSLSDVVTLRGAETSKNAEGINP